MSSSGQSYAKSFARCVLLIAAGATLQFITASVLGPDRGGVPEGFLRHPLGLILAVNYLYLLILAYFFRNRFSWLKTLLQESEYISAMVCMLLMLILFGLTGLNLASSWPFCFLSFYFMTLLGLRTIADLALLPRGLPLARTLMHGFVFLLIAARIFGTGDKISCKITLQRGHPQSIAIDDSGREIHLPFSLTLEEFSMEEYPPALYLYDSGQDALSDNFLSLEGENPSGELGPWQITVDKYIESAALLPGESNYVPMNHVGTAPAAYVKVSRSDTLQQDSGWVSCGSHIFASSSLRLPSSSAETFVVMPGPRASSYLSKVRIAGSDGTAKTESIRVNHPAKHGVWRIYQVGYDTSMGKWSTVSILECVKDPWLPAVKFALWGIMAGVFLFFVSGVFKNRRK